MMKSHNFKEPKTHTEYQKAPVVLRMLMDDFCLLSERMGVSPVCTRIKGKIEGDSGVHADYRAADFRHEYAPGKFLYTKAQKDEILDGINSRWPRSDGKQTAICHSFSGGPEHFHLQVPRDVLVLK